MKKGLSSIMTSVLLIAIVVVIAGIIVNFSVGLLNQQKEKSLGFSNYYDAELYVLTELASLPPNHNPDDAISLGIRRKDNEKNVTGVRFIFEDDKGNSYSYDVYENPPNEAGLVVQYPIKLGDIGASSFLDVEKISIRLLYEFDKPTMILDEVEIE